MQITKYHRIYNVQHKITSSEKAYSQHAELVIQLIISKYETQDRWTLLESNKIEENFTLIAKENIEVGKAVKFSKRKIINESSTIRVSVKNTNKNGENVLQQETNFNYPKENKMITIYILEDVVRLKVET